MTPAEGTASAVERLRDKTSVVNMGHSTIKAGDRGDKSMPRTGSPLLALCGTGGRHAEDLCAAVELGLADSNNIVQTCFYDDRRSASCATEIAEAIAAAGTKYVIGHFSTQAALAASHIYGRNDIVFLAPGTSAPHLCSTEAPTTLQVFGTDDEQFECLTNAAECLSRSVVLIAQTHTYGSELARRLFPRLASHCDRLGVLYFEMPPPHALPLRTRAEDVVMILGSQEFADACLRGPLRSAAYFRILLSDDCFTPALFSDPELASRCSIAFLEESGEMIIDQELSDLRGRAAGVLDRMPGPYFETSYIATRALVAAWQTVGTDRPLAVLRHLLSDAWPSPFGLLKFSSDRRLQGHRWHMVTARSMLSRHSSIAPARSPSGQGSAARAALLRTL
jgi:branched-chain amino acid transport system substrate-binding protein